jgi:hypothetical protein
MHALPFRTSNSENRAFPTGFNMMSYLTAADLFWVGFSAVHHPIIMSRFQQQWRVDFTSVMPLLTCGRELAVSW